MIVHPAMLPCTAVLANGAPGSLLASTLALSAYKQVAQHTVPSAGRLVEGACGHGASDGGEGPRAGPATASGPTGARARPQLGRRPRRAMRPYSGKLTAPGQGLGLGASVTPS